MGSGPINVLHVSDLHFGADPRRRVNGQLSDDTLDEVLERSAHRYGIPDVIVATGDIADDSSAAAYRRVADRLRTAAPQVHWVPGNHDTPALMAELAPDGFPSVIALSEWELILLNSSWSGHDEGLLGDDQLNWLNAQLARGHAPVIVALHHPPLSACSNPECQLADAPDLTRLLEGHPRVRAVLSGHQHRPFDRPLKHAIALGAPSTCRQIHHQLPGHAWTNEAPAARFLVLHSDGHLSHHLFWAREPASTPRLEWWDHERDHEQNREQAPGAEIS